MGLTVGSIPILRPLAIVPGFDAGNAEQGVFRRTWQLSALYSPAEWLDVLDLFETWRTAREPESIANISNSLGSTVTLDGAFRGQVWSNVACWFQDAPSQDQAGRRIRGSFTLIDAAEALEMARRLQRLDQDQAQQLDFGTYTIGGVELTLTKKPDGLGDGPKVETAATGADVITGPLLVAPTLDIEGWTTAPDGWATIKTWYATSIASPPASGTWWPTAKPTVVAEPWVVGTTRTVRYLVTVPLRFIL